MLDGDPVLYISDLTFSYWLMHLPFLHFNQELTINIGFHLILSFCCEILLGLKTRHKV